MIVYLGNEQDFETITGDGVVLVDFYADWCGPCKMIDREFQAIDASNPDVKIVKVNVDDYGRLAGKFSIMSIPTMMLFKNGKPVATKVGYMTKDKILSFYQQ